MGIEIDGTVYSNAFEDLHGRKPGDPAPEPVLAPQPDPVTIYSTDYAAITGRKPGAHAAETVPSVPAPRVNSDENVRAKVITTDSAPAPVKSSTAELA